MTFNTVKCTAIALVALTMTSCTLDDPENSKATGDNASLSYITLAGAKAITYDYDTQGRLTSIASLLYGIDVNISYNPLTIEYIERDETSTWDEATDDYVYHLYISSRTVLSDIQLNSNGYITQCTETETNYNSNGVTTSHSTSSVYYTYNSKNQLIKSNYGSLNSNDYTIFEWDSKGNLTYTTDSDSSINQRETVSITYSDTENAHSQWSFFWVEFVGDMLTGYFGVAPAYLPSSFSYQYGTNTPEVTQLSYKLNNAGYIQNEMIYEDGDLFTVTYHYGNASIASTASAVQAKSISAQPRHKAKSMFHKK